MPEAERARQSRDPALHVIDEAARAGARSVCLATFPEHDIGALLERVSIAFRRSPTSVQVVHDPPVYFPSMTVAENLMLVGRPRPRSEQRGRSHRAMALLDELGGAHDTQPSNKMALRIALARSFADDPEVIVLVRPINRLEWRSSQVVVRLISERARQGRQTFFAARRLDTARSMADMVAVVRNRQLEYFGPPSDLAVRREQALLAGSLGIQTVLATDLNLAAASGGTQQHRAQQVVDSLEVLVAPFAVGIKLNSRAGEVVTAGSHSDDIAELTEAASRIHDLDGGQQRVRIALTVASANGATAGWVLTTAPEHRTLLPIPVLAAEIAHVLARPPAPAATVDDELAGTPTPRARSLTVLICDDDPAMTELIKTMLDRIGLESERFHTAAEMIDAVRRRPQLVLACVVDQGLPDLAGHRLIAQIRSLDPVMPIVLISGDDRMHPSLEDLDSFSYVTKPFTLNQLHDSLRPHIANPASSW